MSYFDGFHLENKACLLKIVGYIAYLQHEGRLHTKDDVD